MSNHAGVPLGESAAWVMASPRASETTWDVPAVPRNWQPPPGDAQARQPTSWAYCKGYFALCESCADGLNHAGIFAAVGCEGDAAGDNDYGFVAESGEGHHHCGEAFVAGCDSHYPAGGW